VAICPAPSTPASLARLILQKYADRELPLMWGCDGAMERAKEEAKNTKAQNASSPRKKGRTIPTLPVRESQLCLNIYCTRSKNDAIPLSVPQDAF
jgi:hypothetical protein